MANKDNTFTKGLLMFLGVSLILATIFISIISMFI
jgi:hypothetical protein